MKRRKELAALADTYEYGKRLPHIEYTDSEKRTWGAVYDKLRGLSGQFACKEYLHNLERMEQYCGYGLCLACLFPHASSCVYLCLCGCGCGCVYVFTPVLAPRCRQ